MKDQQQIYQKKFFFNQALSGAIPGLALSIMLGIGQEWWGAMICGLIGLGFLFYRTGLAFDVSKRRFRTFFTVYGIKLGRWEKLSDYPDLVVLRSKKKYSEEELDGEIPTYGDSSWIEYELYLASPNHFNLILINSYEDKMTSYHAAEDLVSLIGCELVQYNPGQRRRRKLLSVQNGELILDGST